MMFKELRTKQLWGSFWENFRLYLRRVSLDAQGDARSAGELQFMIFPST